MLNRGEESHYNARGKAKRWPGKNLRQGRVEHYSFSNCINLSITEYYVYVYCINLLLPMFYLFHPSFFVFHLPAAVSLLFKKLLLASFCCCRIASSQQHIQSNYLVKVYYINLTVLLVENIVHVSLCIIIIIYDYCFQ